MNQVLYNEIVTQKNHRSLRRRLPETLAEEYAAQKLSPVERMTRRFELLCAEETPAFLPEEKICFLRTIENLPPIFTDAEWNEIKSKYYIHELGYHSNVCADYERVLKHGLLSLRKTADEYGVRVVDALLSLIDRYREAALKAGLTDIATSLESAPRTGATNFREALQLFRILNYALWLEGDYHNNIGRFDQYMFPYLKADMDAGVLTQDEALDLTEELFLSLNRDSDLYPGVQQGDNGQSMMLGGKTADGDGFNLLSELCLIASRNLCLIDPKINLRVGKDTPDRIFTLGSELTKAGLGFPQYSNDDIVIPGLIAYGYAPEDAINYTVAACWEFIIPAVGGDIANIAALSLPKVVDTCLHRDLANCATMEEFRAAVKAEIQNSCDDICNSIGEVWFIPSPFLDQMMSYENGTPKYQNFGIHGVGASTAADSLSAIEQWVFGGDVTAERMIHAVDTDFADDPELLHRLRFESHKLGCNSEEADNNLVFVMDSFADALDGKRNYYNGCWRAGTGSAMYYLWSAEELDASPDGRRKGEPFAANYSISLFANPDGPFSLIRSMTKPNLARTLNGGPLTVEFHHSLFKTEEAVEQVGQFVKKFMELGGHQLQLNAVNADKMRAAQEHPEQYPQLIVRIWGWSAYFTELDRAYQDHVIRRQEYNL